MSVSTAIGLVSASLRNLLVGEMRLNPAVPVTILAPDETGGDQRDQSVPLQGRGKRVPEEPGLDAEAGKPEPVGAGAAVAQPVLSDDAVRAQRSADRQRDGARNSRRGHAGVLREPGDSRATSSPDLKTAREQLRIVIQRARPGRAQPDLDHVRPALPALGALPGLHRATGHAAGAERPCPSGCARSACRTSARRSTRRGAGMSPASGPAGTAVTFTGQNLAGWRATVVVGRPDGARQAER